MGTPQWMSPEAVSAEERGVDCKTDIWSLGITTLEMANAGLPIEMQDKTPDDV